ncbi:MAG: hypothetical protein ACLP7Q_26730, partial [Isosphaeraceae bacterium]
MLKNIFAFFKLFRLSAGILTLAAAAPGAAQAGAAVFTPSGSGPTGLLQYYQVPTTGIYDITAFGAAGGASLGISAGGLGAEVGGDFALTAGELLIILVGQAGSPGFAGGGGGGGM